MSRKNRTGAARAQSSNFFRNLSQLSSLLAGWTLGFMQEYDRTTLSGLYRGDSENSRRIAVDEYFETSPCDFCCGASNVVITMTIVIIIIAIACKS